MGKYVATAVISAVFTAVAVSAFWIWFYNFVPGTAAADRRGSASGEKITTEAETDGIWVGPAGLAIPIPGLKPGQLIDTYTQARAGGARTHDAIDIMAAEGTPVVAAADGTVEKLFVSQGGGGITAYVRSPDRRWTYYYAHLQSYAPGLAEGQHVRRGQPIGRVGHTGNAVAAGPHLHFAVLRMQPGERWWQGSPINPYPLLAGKQAKG